MSGRSHIVREDGMALIEVVVAAFCLALIVGAAATLFATGNDSSLAVQRQSQLVAVANQQIETLRQGVKTNSAGFAGLAMNAPPAAGTNSTLSYSGTTHTDPDDFVSSASGCGTSNEGYLIEANYDNTAEGLASGVVPSNGCPTGAEPLVVQAGGIVTPKMSNVAVGSGTATVYTFVTDVYLGCSSSLGSCTSTSGDARRVIVAVAPNNGGRFDAGPNSPVYVSTIFTNPVPSNQVNNSIGLTLGANLG